MKEKWISLIETPPVSAYQKGDKYLILAEKETTLQTPNRIQKKSRDSTTPPNKNNPNNQPSK